ncbi:MAG: chemotaxis protein CheR, partial [Pseudomonadota bacterium]|nr:chemotaxis protein CheR [Pseudomonadota bacterium]
MQVEDFKQWLKGTMGLDPASVGSTVIERGVASRMAACARPDLSAYWHYVRNSPDEQQELIEAVIVPETSFFRDPEAFSGLVGVYN